MMHRVAQPNSSKAGGGKHKMKLLILALSLSAVYANSFTPACKKNIYCNSKLLHDVQMARILPDSKDFVDLHLKFNERAILSNFGELLNSTHNHLSNEQLLKFVTEHFDSVSELENWKPGDFNPEPEFLRTITDPKLKQFARVIINIWPSLGRKVKPIVFQKPEYFSMIPVKNGFIIPGGRFKELYYWDTYWIIEGLLISGMKDTVKGIISNLIELQREIGHVPYGNRYYYQERSQPPLLSAMMAIYLRETNDIKFLKDNIDALESELEYWLHTHSVVFKVAGKEHTLLRYYAPSEGPRPESYYQDYTIAEKLHSEQKQRQFYTDIKSAAESGWDFSSRWLINQNGSNIGNRTEIHTIDIIPVDLNAIFANALQNVAHFNSMINNGRKGVHWEQLSRKWVNSIKEVLFNQVDGIWYDYDLSNSRHRKYFYPSNIAPLWMGVVEPGFIAAKAQGIVNYLKKVHSLEYPGGVPTSLIRSGEQWDFPNASPPLISIIVSALEALQTKESSKLAFEIAQTWVRSNYKGYLANNQLYEKYDVEKPGKGGSGGEYPVQTGFGWTIGAILELLYKYGSTMTSQDHLQQNLNYGTSHPFNSGYHASSPPLSSHFSTVYQTYTANNKQPWTKPGYVTEPPAKYTYIPYAPPKPHQVTEGKPKYEQPSKPVYIPTTQKPLLAHEEYSTIVPSLEVKTEYIPSTTTNPEYIVQAKPESILVAKVKPQYVSPFVSATVKPEYSLQPTAALPENKPEVIAPTFPSSEIQADYVSVSQAKPEYSSSIVYKPQTSLPEIKPGYVPPTNPSVQIKPQYLSSNLAKPSSGSAVLSEHLKPEYLSLTPVQKPEYIPSTLPSSQAVQEQILISQGKPEYKPEYVTLTPVKTEHAVLNKVVSEYNAQAQFKPEYAAGIQIAQSKPEYSQSVQINSGYISKPGINIPPKPAYGLGAPLQSTTPQVLYSTESYVQPSYLTSTPAQIKEYTSYPLSTEYTSTTLQDEYTTSTSSKPEYSTSSLINSQYSTVAPLEDEYVTTLTPLSETTQLLGSPIVPTNSIYRPEYIASAEHLNASVESQNVYNLNLINASSSSVNVTETEEVKTISSENSTSSVLHATPPKFPSVIPIKPIDTVTWSTSNSPILTPNLPLPAFPSKPVNASVHYSGAHREPISLSHYSYNHGVNVFNSPFLYSTPAPVQTVYVSSSPVKTEEISLVPHVAFNTQGQDFPSTYHELSQLVPTHTEQIITAIPEHSANKSEVPVKVGIPVVAPHDLLSGSIKTSDASFISYQLNSEPGYIQNPTHTVFGYSSTSKPVYFTSNQHSYSLEGSADSKPALISSLPVNSVFGTNSQNVFYTSTPVKHSYHSVSPAFAYTARPYYNSGQYTGQYKHSYLPNLNIKQVNVVSKV